MPTTLTWTSVALRLLLIVLASGIIGFNRDERGHSAGLRTNILVGLAACVAMIQANWLINSVGKPVDSFVVMDIMRLPLGILSGIGFIGAGAIIKRGELAVGVTTAATIWFVTVMGLCFGGGQLGLGVAAFAFGFATLWGLKKIEADMARDQSALLKVTIAAGGPSRDEIETLLTRGGISLTMPSLSSEALPEYRTFGWRLHWRGRRQDQNPPAAIQDLSARPDIRSLEFTR